MRFGLVFPCYAPDEDRERWARACLVSLGRTLTAGLDAQPMLFYIPKGKLAKSLLRRELLWQFEILEIDQPSDLHSNDGVLAWGYHHLAANFPLLTHLGMICGDWLFNPRWLLELQQLVYRKPGGKAWWVYRSSWDAIHKTLGTSGPDVSVRSINSGGCVTVEEWREWNFNPHNCPREEQDLDRESLDLIHAKLRPGLRWVTARSYIVNVGLRGICQRPEVPDFAVDFVGVD